MEFKSFSKIENIKRCSMFITQKIHGSNAQIKIEKYKTFTDVPLHHFFEFLAHNNEYYIVKCGSRTRWINRDNDNFGFATFVYDNIYEFVTKLGVGTHFGEWAGPGINSGEGLTEKTFVLFDWHKFPEARPLPPRCKVVPVLYKGEVGAANIDRVMEDLKTNGSQLVPGYMKPEGVVIQIGDNKYKKVFEAEETGWTKTKSDKVKLPAEDYSYLLQPMRLEKILSRDESYKLNYPDSLGLICKHYVQDLIDEGQIMGDEDAIKLTRKALGSQLFAFVKEMMK